MNKAEIIKMSLLDIMAKWEKSEKVIKSYDEITGTCLCCNHLFETLEEVCIRFGISQENIVDEILRATD